PQEHLGVLVGTVLGPEGREETELGVGRLAPELLDDPIVLFGRQPQATRQIQCDLRLREAQSGITRSPRRGGRASARTVTFAGSPRRGGRASARTVTFAGSPRRGDRASARTTAS